VSWYCVVVNVRDMHGNLRRRRPRRAHEGGEESARPSSCAPVPRAHGPRVCQGGEGGWPELCVEGGGRSGGHGQSLRKRFSSLDSAIFPHSVRVKLCLSIPLDGPPGCCAVEAASFMLGATGKNYG
jgi:hypothetical protein